MVSLKSEHREIDIHDQAFEVNSLPPSDPPNKIDKNILKQKE